MKAIIKLKLIIIENKMKEFEACHLYWLNETWYGLNQQRIILNELLNS